MRAHNLPVRDAATMTNARIIALRIRDIAVIMPFNTIDKFSLKRYYFVVIPYG